MKIYSTVIPVGLAEHLQIFIKVCFICSDKRISDNNTYSKGGIRRCKMDCAMERYTERSKYYESNKNSRFYEAPRRFHILCNRQSFDVFVVYLYYHKSCYTK